MPKNSKIILGITGSIAAYKSILLLRLLIKNDYEVKVIITPEAEKFVSSLVLSTLSKHKVYKYIDDTNSWNNHVELAHWADVFVIAPLTCNTLAKMAYGLCDNMLMATYLSIKCPCIIAPAMDEEMWHHATTQKNISTIKQHGVHVLSVERGFLGSGIIGEGRMQEPESIFYKIKTFNT